MRHARAALSALTLAAALSLLSCATPGKPPAGRSPHAPSSPLAARGPLAAGGGARLASRDADYFRLGLARGTAATWEDGMRTDGGPGSYEWWYTDAEFEDGTIIVTVFYTKDHFDVPGPAAPTAEIEITNPDGTRLQRTLSLKPGTLLDASRQRCAVRVGESFLQYDDGRCEIRFVDRDLEYSAVAISSLPMWRPETGHIYFGREEEAYFAWLVAQPSAEITGTLRVGSQLKSLKGRGYHDHNWGNAPMNQLINHWYWGRVTIGDYTVINSDIVAAREVRVCQDPPVHDRQGRGDPGRRPVAAHCAAGGHGAATR